MEQGLAGKVALVTGSGRGIGRTIALALARDGADVMVADMNAESVASTAEEIRKAGRRADGVVGNITEKGVPDAWVKEAVEKLGKLDILVNNAGITRDGLVMRMSEEDWDQVLNVNLRAAFLCAKAALRPMAKQRSGRVINIASVIGLRGNAGQANYAASKAGLIGLTKSLAREYAGRAITVNAIAPGFIETHMTAVLSDEVKAQIMAQIPLGTLGQPEDVAEAVAFLASDRARYITGQVLTVDGGMVM